MWHLLNDVIALAVLVGVVLTVLRLTGRGPGAPGLLVAPVALIALAVLYYPASLLFPSFWR